MNPTSEHMLLHEVEPRLRSGIQAVPRVGSDDAAELLQDGLVIAFRLLQSAETAGKTVTPGNIAFFTIKLLRSGRRSTGFHQADALHPAAQMAGRCRLHSLDEPVAGDESGEEPFTLGETLESRTDDPATEAARRLDWEQLTDQIDDWAKAVLDSLAQGQELTILARRVGRSRSALQGDKDRLAQRIRACLGDDILDQVQERAGWRHGLQATQEKRACRWERQAA
jgi:hypothetical protein